MIALVGFHGGVMDAMILTEVMEYYPGIKSTDLKIFDLRTEKDFLKNQDQFNIVVLNYIFIGLTEEEKSTDVYWKIFKNAPEFKVSDLHSPENWRKRLLSTKAKEIMIFGHDPRGEVSSEYIGSLPNYQLVIIKKENSFIWRYINV